MFRESANFVLNLKIDTSTFHAVPYLCEQKSHHYTENSTKNLIAPFTPTYECFSCFDSDYTEDGSNDHNSKINEYQSLNQSPSTNSFT